MRDPAQIAMLCLVAVTPLSTRAQDGETAPSVPAYAVPATTTPDSETAPPAAAEPQSEGSGASAPPYAASIPVATGVPEAEPATKGPRGNRVIEEIVVTAQKREEKLQDVPISVAAFSGDKLEALGVNDPKDLQLITPGLTYSSLVGYSIIYIRGIGTDVFIPSADTSVATYIDGVYFPFAHSLATSFTKLERIEVLKGPQGTLFGRNSTGGAINIVSKKPSNFFEGSVDATVSNFGGRNVKAFVTGPLLTDSVTGSLALVYDNAGQYNYFAPSSPVQSLPDDQTYGLNGKLRWEITDNLSAQISTYLTAFKGVGSVISSNTNTTPLGKLVGAGKDNAPYEISINEPDSLKANNKVVYSNIEYRPDPLDVKLLLSHQAVHTNTLFDYDAGPGNAVYYKPTNQFIDATTGELQIVSKPGGWLSEENIEWTAGYYYFQSRGGFDPGALGVFNPDSPSAPVGTTGISLAGLLGGGLDKLNQLGIVSLPDRILIEVRGVVRTRANAGYTQATWRPTEWFGLTLGGRYQSEDRGIVKSSSALSRPGDTAIPLFNFPKRSTTTNNFSPKITLDSHPFGDDTLIYLSGQKGQKSGTYNVVSIYTPPSHVKPEQVTAVELGIKGDLLSNTFHYNAAVFQNKVKDLQTLVVSLTSGGAVQLVNAAQATIRGVDFDLIWQLFPGSLPGLAMTADGSYLHGRYDNFPNAPGFDQTTGLYFGPGQLVPSPERNFAGNKTVRTPKYSANLGLSYAFEVPGGDLETGVNGSYNSGYFYDTQNTARQPEFVIVNGRLSYLYDPWKLRVTAFGKNLTNKVYFLNKFPNDFGTNTTYAAPRQYGLTLGWEF